MGSETLVAPEHLHQLCLAGGRTRKCPVAAETAFQRSRGTQWWGTGACVSAVMVANERGEARLRNG